MALIKSHHQIEIRFTPILNFDTLSKSIIAPYLKISSSFNIEEENSVRQRITLGFDSETYKIVFHWDRLILTTSAPIDNFNKAGSIIEEPFFSILQKIIKLEEFGKVLNCLYYRVKVNSKDAYDNSKFTKDFLSKNTISILPFTDSGVVIEKIVNGETTNVSIGPYLGIIDVQKRGIKFAESERKELSKPGGIIADVKIFKIVDKVSFRDYQGITEEAEKIFESVWKLL